MTYNNARSLQRIMVSEIVTLALPSVPEDCGHINWLHMGTSLPLTVPGQGLFLPFKAGQAPSSPNPGRASRAEQAIYQLRTLVTDLLSRTSTWARLQPPKSENTI